MIEVDTAFLQGEVERYFPITEMPERKNIPFHKDGCYRCEELAEQLEEFRGKVVSSVLIRSVYLDLTQFSAEAFCWLLPYYLRFCLSEEAELSQMETEFLVFSLRPQEGFIEDTVKRLSLLYYEQVVCLRSFLNLISRKDKFKHIVLDVDSASSFLDRLLLKMQAQEK